MFIFVYVGIMLIVIQQIYIFKSLHATRRAIKELNKGKQNVKRRVKKVVLNDVPKDVSDVKEPALLKVYSETEIIPEAVVEPVKVYSEAKTVPEAVTEPLRGYSEAEAETETEPQAVAEPKVMYINMQETGPKCLLEEFRSNEIALKLDMLIKTGKKYIIADLKIQDVADELGVNRTYLSYAINKTYNQNFKAYLNQYRFETMNELLLKRSDRSYEDIAIKCGFGSVDTLRRVVRSKTGMNIYRYKTYLLDDIPLPPLKKSNHKKRL